MVAASLVLVAVLPVSQPVVAPLPGGERVEWRRGDAPVVLVLPQGGEGWLRIAERVTGAADAAAALQQASGGRPSPLLGIRVPVPWSLATGELRVAAAGAIFPRDRRVARGWEHEVLAPWGGDGESWWELAEWFCGDGSLYARVREANPGVGMFPPRGTRILVPAESLRPEFRGLRPVAAATADAKAGAPAPPATDVSPPARVDRPPPVASGSPAAGASGTATPDAQARPPEVTAAAALTFGDGEAVYRLKAGEALYSAVVVRFTGQLHAADVNATAAEIARRSGVSDVTGIAIGHPIRIPFELLLPEYLPAGHPRRQAWERERQELASVRRAIRAANLEGIHVILDAGHGGRDSGAVVADVWEATYVYDVMARVRRVLQRETRATVWTVVRDDAFGDEPPDLDVLPQQRRQRLLVDPPYALDEPATGVHLRWVLTDSLLARLRRQKVAAERVAFVSIHADSLHPAVRGMMAYVPARGLRAPRSPVARVDWACRELAELPPQRFAAPFAARSEALSTQLGEAIVRAAGRSGLPVHPYQPVRSSVLRGGARWVPAVLKYSQAPTSVLVEVCNLNNDQDRALLLTSIFREKLAHTIAAGIAEAFAR